MNSHSEAYKQGQNAFRREGKSVRDNPYDPGTEQYKAWRVGFNMEHVREYGTGCIPRDER